MGKVPERVVLAWLQEEFGLQPRHSTTYQVLRLVEHVSGNFHMKKSTGAVFLDCELFDDVCYPNAIAQGQDHRVVVRIEIVLHGQRLHQRHLHEDNNVYDVVAPSDMERVGSRST